MRYKQLASEQRYQISLLISLNFNMAQIAKQLNVHRSTISRELKRNTIEGCYQAKQAQQLSEQRKVRAKKRCVSEEVIPFIRFCYESEFYFSPEQMSAELKKLGVRVSHEWIYRFIYRDKQQGGKLHHMLRQGKRRYRKGTQDKRGKLLNTVSIEKRPCIVEERSRLGDWEVDLVMGKQGTGAIITLVERKSLLYLIKKVPNKQAETVAKGITSMLAAYRQQVHTLTFDNGKEFARHQEIARELDAECYFAHPYSAWERGLNENFNGLLRQYIPKGTDLRKVSAQRIKRIELLLNIRPRKTLNYERPLSVFRREIKSCV